MGSGVPTTWRTWQETHPLPLPQNDQAEEKLLSEFVARHSFAEAYAALVERDVRREYLRLLELLGNRDHWQSVAATAFRPEAVAREGDRDPTDFVLRTTRALLADLSRRDPAGSGPRWSESWRGWRPKVPHSTWLGRQNGSPCIAASANCDGGSRFPTRCSISAGSLSSSVGLSVANHMCDQYYGNFARAGGGLFVLDDPFGPTPRVRNVLRRLDGRKRTIAGTGTCREARCSSRPCPMTGIRCFSPTRSVVQPRSVCPPTGV